MNVLIINGHPRKNSLSEALAGAYAAGARAAGVNLSQLNLYELHFDLNVTHASPRQQPLEPPIRQAQALIAWAHHVVFVYPTWWGTMPALLKGFIDRVLTAGFAFEETEGGTGYEPLLRGKSAQLITTMDTPRWVYQWLYRAPGHNAMRRATLQFCGFYVTSILSFGPVKSAGPTQRQQWLCRARAEGQKLHRGALSPAQRFRRQAGAWLQALRLQFYPMTGLAYATGALAAAQQQGFKPLVFWLGFLWLVLGEISTVFLNEYYDYRTDRQNRFYGPFNGGSRVIVNKLLSFAEVKKGIWLSLALSLVVFGLLLLLLVPGPGPVLAGGLLYVLAPGYTAPPLRLAYRGLGELDVGLIHSLVVVLCGYLFQGGAADEPLPWLLSLPLGVAILPSIILAGIPDREADQAAGKKTLAVRLGSHGAAGLALVCTWLAAALALVFTGWPVRPEVFGGLAWPVIPHAALLTVLLLRYRRAGAAPGRIDGLLVASLTYLVWFALVPFLHLL